MTNLAACLDRESRTRWCALTKRQSSLIRLFSSSMIQISYRRDALSFFQSSGVSSLIIVIMVYQQFIFPWSFPDPAVMSVPVIYTKGSFHSWSRLFLLEGSKGSASSPTILNNTLPFFHLPLYSLGIYLHYPYIYPCLACAV